MTVTILCKFAVWPRIIDILGSSHYRCLRLNRLGLVLLINCKGNWRASIIFFPAWFMMHHRPTNIWSVMNFKRAIYLVCGEQTKTVSSTAWRGNTSQRLGLRKAQLEHVDKKNPKESKSNINYTFPRKDMIHTYYTVMFVWCIYVFNCV